MRQIHIQLALLFSFCSVAVQSVSAFDSRFSMDEYIATLKMNFCQMGTLNDTMVCKPKDWERIYRSPVVGMDNRFDVWANSQDGTVGISMRGTTPRAISWIENFYAAMVPAIGQMKINDSLYFDYCFAEKKDAAVHIGWTYALGAMHKDLLQQIEVQYESGARNFLIFGHSQGGALSYLFYAYTHYLQKSGKLQRDLRFKMVTSAAPKVGNIHFAYDFETYTALSWAYNVINPEDWIPLMPFAVQTTEDMTPTQPFNFIKQGLKTQKLPQRLALSFMYNSMNRKSKKARNALIKNLGKRVGNQVRKERPQFKQPDFHHSINYCRAGNMVILETTEAYYQRFPQVSDDIFVHHMMAPYLFLAEQNRSKFH